MMTDGEIYNRLLERVRQAEETSYMIGHLYKSQDDFNLGQGFLAIGEMFKMTHQNVTNLATGKLRKDAGLG